MVQRSIIYEYILVWCEKNALNFNEVLNSISLPFIQPNFLNTEDIEYVELLSTIDYLNVHSQPLRLYVASAFQLDLWFDCPSFFKKQIETYIFPAHTWNDEEWAWFLNVIDATQKNIWGAFYANRNNLQWFLHYFDISKVEVDSQQIYKDLLATAYNKFKAFSKVPDIKYQNQARGWGYFLMKLLKEFNEEEQQLHIDLIFDDISNR